MLPVGQVARVCRAPLVQARGAHLYSVAACRCFPSHRFNVCQRGEIFSGDALDHETACPRLAPQRCGSDTATGERQLAATSSRSGVSDPASAGRSVRGLRVRFGVGVSTSSNTSVRCIRCNGDGLADFAARSRSDSRLISAGTVTRSSPCEPVQAHHRSASGIARHRQASQLQTNWPTTAGLIAPLVRGSITANNP